ncbi:MAG: hypothetical protein LAN62_03485 [Acidobacteriia bacterium]|nr:hypothetical protein [Terriglobia bacterium]
MHPITLQRWVSQGKLPAPPKRRIGGVSVRLWSSRDVERVQRYKEKSYRKGRGRKKGQKKRGQR